MKCFHFTNGERKEEDDEDGVVSSSRSSKVSWARSLSVASSSVESTRRSEFDSDSRDFTDSLCFYQLLAQRRGNDLRVFTFAELKSATRGFSRALVIGEGGFGCVYRGVVSVPGPDLNSNVDVAVKQLNRNGFQACLFHSGHKEWINEVNFLGVVKHPNLVKLIGYCAEDDERGIQRLLVYELMHNKSLEDHLFSRSPNVLSWSLRLRIAQDAARGLAYLHEEMDFQAGAGAKSAPRRAEALGVGETVRFRFKEIPHYSRPSTRGTELHQVCTQARIASQQMPDEAAKISPQNERGRGEAQQHHHRDNRR
nr:probable receptor-like protein kinase At5g47070 [Ipomoea batatas]